MKRIKTLKWMAIAILFVMGVSACGSSRIAPGVSLGVPLKKGKAPDVGITWYGLEP